MDNCEKFDSLIEAYLDGALSDEENKQFEEHISSCEKCRESFEIAKKMHNMLENLDYKLEVPSDFCDRLYEKIEQLPKKKSIYTYSRRIGTIAACIVIAVVVAKSGTDTNITKNAEELRAEDSAGPVITSIISENPKDEIITHTNTTETTKDKQEASKEESNTQKKAIETGTATQRNIKESERKDKPAGIAVPSPTPEALNNTVKEQAEADAAKEVSEAILSDEAGVPEAAEATPLMLTDAPDEKQEATTQPETVTQAEEKAPASGGSLGGGGGSSSTVYSARRMTVLELKVDIENIEKANKTASKYAPMQNGVYTMNAENVKKLLSELDAEGISAIFPDVIENEEISFTITAK